MSCILYISSYTVKNNSVDFEIIKDLFFSPGQLPSVSTTTPRVKELSFDFWVKVTRAIVCRSLNAHTHTLFSILCLGQWISYAAWSGIQTQHACQCKNHLIFRWRITPLHPSHPHRPIQFSAVCHHPQAEETQLWVQAMRSLVTVLWCFAWTCLDLRQSGGSLHTKQRLFVNTVLELSALCLWMEPLSTKTRFSPMFGPHSALWTLYLQDRPRFALEQQDGTFFFTLISKLSIMWVDDLKLMLDLGSFSPVQRPPACLTIAALTCCMKSNRVVN